MQAVSNCLKKANR